MIFSKLKKFKPSSQSLMTFLIFLLVVDLILLVFLNRKPICIESSLIDHIEWISDDSKKATIYKCDLQKSAMNTESIIEKREDLQKRINVLENLLKINFTPKRPIKILILDSKSELIQSSSDTIIIDETNFFVKNLALERAYIKSWLQQFQKIKSQGLGLMRLDILTHFLLWNLGINNHYEPSWQNILSHWPQTATTWSGYCHSPIKDDIYNSLCINPTISQKDELFIPLSTSFWLSQKLWHSFQLLPLSDQIQFFKTIGQFVEILSESDSLDINEMTLRELQEFIKSEVQTWKQYLIKFGFRDWANNFEIKVNLDLESNSRNLGRADLLIKKSGSWTLKELNQYQQLSFDELSYRILALNQEGLWGFPWLAPIKPSALPSVKSTSFVWITCEWPSVLELLDTQEHADKVLIVNQCEESKEPLIFSGLLHRGLQFFSLDNRDINFVQINLEALRYLLKKDGDLKEKRLGAFQQVDGRTHYLAAKANWASALWNPQYRAYEVQASIDVVEWFKLPDNTWPDFN